MESKTILLTGATGYIGGTVLDTLVRLRPHHKIRALLRHIPEGFSEKYPRVEVVRGEYDDFQTVANAAAEANIVIHGGNSKHENVIKAHIAGLLRRQDTSFFIRLGGTGVIADWKDGNYGELNPKIWSDIDHIETLTSMPDDTLHRPVEKLIQEAAEMYGEKLKTAIICSSGVYGKGKGLARTQSYYMPDFYDQIVKLGSAFYTQSGNNKRGWVHVDDLMKVYLSLVDAAAMGGGSAIWGKEGYYFTGSQETSQYELATKAGAIMKAHGLIHDAKPIQMSVEDMKAMRLGSSWKYQAIYTFACNTRVRADRARKFLGYKPNAPTVLECMEEDLMARHKSK